MTGLILQFAYDYTDDNRKTLSQFTTQYDLVHFLKKKHLVEQFAQYAEKRGLKRRNLMIKRSYHLLEEYIMSRMVYNLLDEDAWVEYLNQDDPTIKEALRVFKQGLAFPQPPTKEAGQQVALSKGKAPRLTAHRYLA